MGENINKFTAAPKTNFNNQDMYTVNPNDTIKEGKWHYYDIGLSWNLYLIVSAGKSLDNLEMENEVVTSDESNESIFKDTKWKIQVKKILKKSLAGEKEIHFYSLKLNKYAGKIQFKIKSKLPENIIKEKMISLYDNSPECSGDYHRPEWMFRKVDDEHSYLTNVVSENRAISFRFVGIKETERGGGRRIVMKRLQIKVPINNIRSADVHNMKSRGMKEHIISCDVSLISIPKTRLQKRTTQDLTARKIVYFSEIQDTPEIRKDLYNIITHSGISTDDHLVKWVSLNLITGVFMICVYSSLSIKDINKDLYRLLQEEVPYWDLGSYQLEIYIPHDIFSCKHKP